MKTSKHIKLCLSLGLLTIFTACQKDDDLITTNPEAESINEYFSQLPDWINETAQQEPDNVKNEITINDSQGALNKCQVLEKNLVKSLQNIVSVETNFGVVWPGAIIQGNSLEGGELQLLSLDRSPITINTDLAIGNTSKNIDKPNSVTVQQAIAEIQIEAGQMPEGSQSGAGVMNFLVEEASTFEQSMLSMGISAGFTEPQSQVGLKGSANVSVERTFNDHTVVAKFVQEMFTIRLADDLIPTTADFFAPDVTLDEIEDLENSGEIGAENLPLYIESVTYGRIMLFTLRSTTVASGTELSAALEASFADYVEGGANLTAEQKEALSSRTYKVFSAGGTKEAANKAIAELNYSEFFKAAPATTAVPISFVAKTLNGKKIVKILNNLVYDQRDGCVAPYAYEVHVTLDKVKLESGTCLNCKYSSHAFENGKIIGNLLKTGNITLNGTIVPLLGSGKFTTIKENGQLELSSTVTGLLTADKSSVFNFPFSEINGTIKRDHLVNEAGRAVRFTYTLKRTPMYE